MDDDERMATDGRTDDDERTDGWLLVFHNTLFKSLKNVYYALKMILKVSSAFVISVF